MRRLPPVNKNLLFGAGPSRSPAPFAGMRCCPTIRLLVAACAPERFRHPVLSSCSRLTSIRTHALVLHGGAVPVGVRRSGAAISGSVSIHGSVERSTNRIEGTTQSPGRGGQDESTPVTFSTRAMPHAATIVVFPLRPHVTGSSPLPPLTTRATARLAVGPAARLPATRARAPHTDP
jgi:hypothetical protein